MNEPLQLSGTDHIAHERVSELRHTAHELRLRHRGEGDGDGPGLVARTRAVVGRRIVAFGSTVAGHHA